MQTTDCLYLNAVNLKVVTNDTVSWVMTVTSNANVASAQGILCELPNGTYANNMAVTLRTRTAATMPSITTQASRTGAGGFPMIPAGWTMFTANASTAATNLGGDIELALAPNAPSGAQSVFVTYTPHAELALRRMTDCHFLIFGVRSLLPKH